MKRNVYKKLTLTIAATGLLLPSTVAHAAEQTENEQQVTISKQTEATENPSDGLNNQSAPKESIPTQMPLSEKESSNENTKPSTDTTTKQGEQTSTQSNDISTNEEINSKQEESSEDTTEPQSNSQHEDNSKDQANSDNPTDSSNHDETNQTEHGETGSEDNHAEKPEENDGHETNSEDNHAEKTEENNSNEKEPSGGASAQNEGSTSQSVEPMPVEPTPTEPQTEKPSIPSNPTVPGTPDTNSTEDNIPSNTQSEQNVYQPNQQVTSASIYHSSASDISNNSHFASVIPFQNFSFNEQHVNDEAMPFSNIGLSNARFGHLITGSFKYNPFIVHQVGMISNDVHSNESDVREILRMQSFSNNSNLNDLQENTGYFKYQYFSPINAQQYYENLDLQILGLVTADLGSMPDLKEIKRGNKAEAEQTAKTSEDTKQHEKTAKKKGTEKNTDNQKYPRLLNTLLVVFGVAFIWFIILMIMKYKKK